MTLYDITVMTAEISP